MIKDWGLFNIIWTLSENKASLSCVTVIQLVSFYLITDRLFGFCNSLLSTLLKGSHFCNCMREDVFV